MVRAVGDEATAALTSDYHAAMAAAVEANGGVVLERIGDSVLAVFRNAGAAARAAVAAREAVNDIAWPPECDVSVTIVLHSGRWSGDPRRPDAGTALMRLARIATVAERGQVLVSQATASLIEGDRDAPTLRSVGNGRLPTSTSRYVSTR